MERKQLSNGHAEDDFKCFRMETLASKDSNLLEAILANNPAVLIRELSSAKTLSC